MSDDLQPEVTPAEPVQYTEEAPPHPEPSNWDRPFWRSVFSDDMGTGSTNRLGTLAVVFVTLTTAAYLIIRDNRIPENIVDLAYFASLLITVVYSPGKIAEILRGYFRK